MINKIFTLLLFMAAINCYGQTIEAVTPPYYNGNSTWSLNPRYLTVMNGSLYFFGTDDPGSENGNKLWKSDGTWAGTSIVKQINVGGAQYPTIIDLQAIGNLLLFHDDKDKTLWRSDGTTDGTYKIRDNKGKNYIQYKGKIYFHSYDVTPTTSLWVTDGTVAGTKVIKDINTTSETPTEMFIYKDKLFFGASDGLTKQQLWVSDGTDTGTHQLKKINFGNDAKIGGFTLMNNYLYFSAKHNATEYQIWRTNGMADSTIKVTSQCSSCYNGLSPNKMIEYKNKLYFKGSTSGTPRQLWVSDGTDTGTKIFKAEIVGSSAYPPGFADDNFELIKHNGFMYMVGNDSTGFQIWKSDGTKQGTYKVTHRKDLYPFNLTSFDNHIVFLASRKDSVSDVQLYYTDGINEAIMPKIYNQSNDNPFWHITQDPIGQRFTIYNGAVYFPCTYDYWEYFRLYRFYFTKPSGVIKVMKPADGIAVYPNPGTGIFNVSVSIQVQCTKIEVYNTMGLLLYEQESTGGLNTLDLSAYANGFYIVKIRHDNDLLTVKKVIKQ